MALNINGTTGISGVEGSVSAPVLTGTDSNCGISFPAADTIKFSTGGVERLAITNSGLSGDGSGLTGISAGITMAQQYRITASSTFTNNSPLYGNFEVNDTSGYGGIGSGMSESSGVWTFPSTGIYLVDVNQTFHATSNGQDRRCEIRIQHTVDGGNNWGYAAVGYTNLGVGSSTTFGTASCQSIVDVTNTSQVKVRFDAHSQESATQLTGNSGNNDNSYTFIRLGDT